jgi:hypothetical protein
VALKLPRGYKEHYGTNVSQMSILLRNRKASPMSVAGFMKSRLMYGDTFPDVLNNYFDSSDLVAYSDAENGKVKFIFTTDNKGRITKEGRVALRLINPRKERINSAVVLGDRYDALQGIEVPVNELGILGKSLTRAQILDSKVWRMLSRNPNEVPKEIAEDAQLLPEYVDFIASRREARGWAPFPIMDVYVDSLGNNAKLRAFFVDGLEDGSPVCGWGGLDFVSGRLVGLAPEAQAKLNGWKPVQKNLTQAERKIITIEDLLSEASRTESFAPDQVKILKNILEQRGYVITPR